MIPLPSAPVLHPAPDPARDPRIEDPSNLWAIDRAAHALLPLALRLRVPANAISIAGLAAGAAAGFAYHHWPIHAWALLGFLLSILWLVADSLDGMVARATGTTSAFGRELDGLCDYGVFFFLYAALAGSIDTRASWSLAIAAAICHAFQANLYEAERARFHRRLRVATARVPSTSRNPLVRAYDTVTASLDWAAAPFDRLVEHSNCWPEMIAAYARAAVPPLRFMLLLTQNTRVLAIFVACLWSRPEAFWWFEIGPLSIVAIVGIVWQRRVEAGLARSLAAAR